MKERLPDLNECLAMMRSKDCMTREEGFDTILQHVSEFVPQLMLEFEDDSNEGMRGWLLELIGEACDPRAFPLFKQQLRSESPHLRNWAIRGPHLLDSSESRELLLEAANYELESPQATAEFRAELAAAENDYR